MKVVMTLTKKQLTLLEQLTEIGSSTAIDYPFDGWCAYDDDRLAIGKIAKKLKSIRKSEKLR